MGHLRGLPPRQVALLAEGFTGAAEHHGLQRLCDIAVETTAASSAAVLLTSPDRSRCEVVATDPRARAVIEAQLAGGGPTTDALRSGRVVVVLSPLARAAGTWPRFAVACAGAGFASAWSVPLAAGGQRFGALGLLSEHAGPPAARSVADTRTLASLAAALLAACRRREEARALVEQLRRALTTRTLIEQAKGRLVERHGLPADAAFERLRRHARDHNLRIHLVAAAVARGELQL